MACGFRTYKRVRYYQPDCMGGAAMGPSYCTCKTTSRFKSEKEMLLNRIDALEEKVDRLLSHPTNDTGER